MNASDDAGSVAGPGIAPLEYVVQCETCRGPIPVIGTWFPPLFCDVCKSRMTDAPHVALGGPVRAAIAAMCEP